MQIGAICHMELMVKVLSPSYVNTYPSGTVYNKTNQAKILSGYLSQAAGEDLIYHIAPVGRRKYFSKSFENFSVFRIWWTLYSEKCYFVHWVLVYYGSEYGSNGFVGDRSIFLRTFCPNKSKKKS